MFVIAAAALLVVASFVAEVRPEDAVVGIAAAPLLLLPILLAYGLARRTADGAAADSDGTVVEGGRAAPAG
jgi:hypothetical protein